MHMDSDSIDPHRRLCTAGNGHIFVNQIQFIGISRNPCLHPFRHERRTAVPDTL